ncbi:Mfs transporter [Pleurostoma richardsiae]|uniref:Mfs transporter n=1 Tax=Pleurostoma richardsiae TaxID=41990 RepID=A0AA38RRZ5_9PEZI|nr:Mfs transporter [Pleurostoma richardsiae]
MATIINSDLVPQKQRGMYQAFQNVLHGLGSICGASLGGLICDAIGWRFCFLLQVPVSVAALIIGKLAIPEKLKVEGDNNFDLQAKRPSKWEQIDLSGAGLLFTGLSLQLAAMSMGSNGMSWANPAVVICLVCSCLLLAGFFTVETKTRAIPIMPLGMLKSTERAALLIINACLGISGYGFLFLMPLFFQSVLLDSASVAGLRLVAPSLATPIGGLTTGLIMRHGDRLSLLTRAGLLCLIVGGWFNLSLGMTDPLWKYSVYLMVGSFGQGMAYPSSLFGFIRACDHKEHAVATSLLYLVRSMGAVWGVASVSTVTQTVLASKMSDAFSDKPGGPEIIEALKHSVEVLHRLPPEARHIAQGIYYDACRTGLYFLLGVNVVSMLCSLLVPYKRRGAGHAEH